MIWVKRIALAILALLLFLVIAVAVILYTPAGLKVASWGAQKALPALSIGTTKGSLLSGFQVDDVRYQDSSMNLAVSQLNLTLDERCLLTPEICISDLGVKGVKFSMPTLPPATEPEQPSEPVAEISLPVPIKIDKITLDNIDLDILANKVSWQHFTTAATVVGSHVTLKPTDWQNIKLALAPAEKSDKANAKSVTKVKAKSDTTAITLPDVVLPMSFDIERFTIKNFELAGKTPQKVSLLELIASGKGSEVNVEKLQVNAPQADLNAKHK
ncbi:hypothetical protein [Photobacterium aquimaris]|uniref:hypothetical protein n=1 Tax=Photobacterium aquimaris TaxID=512643 RepID=UPI000AE1E10A